MATIMTDDQTRGSRGAYDTRVDGGMDGRGNEYRCPECAPYRMLSPSPEDVHDEVFGAHMRTSGWAHISR
jgi:hypothetical protein